MTTSSIHSNNNRLWYKRPATKWDEALPIGNGKVGALVYGETSCEIFELNEETIWTGSPYNPSRKGAYKHLDQVRKHLNEREFYKAHDLFGETMMGTELNQMSYQPLGTLSFDFGHAFSACSDYYRDLNMENALSTTCYSHEGVQYKRESFVSALNNVVVVRFSADKNASISFKVDFKGSKDGEDIGDAIWSCVTETDQDIVLTGRTASKNEIPGKVAFEGRARIFNRGGEIKTTDKSVIVENANEVTIYIAAATNVVNYKQIDADPAKRVDDILNASCKKSFEELFRENSEDHAKLFSRVRIDLKKSLSDIPTDERLKSFDKKEDLGLNVLLYQYGRYLLITSSREFNNLPANLQGIWNPHRTPSWGSKFTSNINLPMNYWPAEVGDLGECLEPLVAMVEAFAETGAQVAKDHYNCGGWVFHQNTDAWMASAPMDAPYWGMWTGGGSWLIVQLYDHYKFSKDIEFLKRIYPLLKGSAEFFIDHLTEDSPHDYLVLSPSTSPENGPKLSPVNKYPYKPGGINYSPGIQVCIHATMDTQLLNDLFSACIEASVDLGVDSDLRETWNATQNRLPPMSVGKRGNLQEWFEDFGEAELHQRHLSHLYGAFPSDQITIEEAPELVKAVKASLRERGDQGTGFSVTWKAAIRARFREGNYAQLLLTTAIDDLTCVNGFSSCFGLPQLDGAYGFTGALAEMLIQSHKGVIRLLPALPDDWSDGSYRGLRARGGFKVDLNWKAKRCVSATIQSVMGGECRVQCPQGSVVKSIKSNGSELSFQNKESGAISFKSELNQSYELEFIANGDLAASQIVPNYSKEGPENDVIHALKTVLTKFEFMKLENELLVQAGELSEELFKRAMHVVKPNVNTNEILNSTPGKNVNVVSGELNLWQHVTDQKSEKLIEGEFLTIDIFNDNDQTTLPMSRLITNNGICEDWRNDMRTFLSIYHEALISCLKIGKTIQEALAEAKEMVEPQVNRKTLTAGVYRYSALAVLDRKENVIASINNNEPMVKGQLMVVAPIYQIYDGRIHLRLADTVLLTEGGAKVLTGKLIK